MRPRYGLSLKRTGAFASSSEAKAIGPLELNVEPPDDEATTSRNGVRGAEAVSRTLLVPAGAVVFDADADPGESGGPSIVASIPAASSRATTSSASSRGRFDPTTSPHVLVSVS